MEPYSPFAVQRDGPVENLPTGSEVHADLDDRVAGLLDRCVLNASNGTCVRAGRVIVHEPLEFITAADAASQGLPDAYPGSDMPGLLLTTTGPAPSLRSDSGVSKCGCDARCRGQICGHAQYVLRPYRPVVYANTCCIHNLGSFTS